MEIYRVGGAVRDQLLQQPSKDNDWVVVGATAAEMEAQGYIPIGKDFPVFLHPKTKEEYALARTERKQGHGYKGFQFYTDTSVTLEEDLERRDLTINAIAEASDGTLIDPYGGQQDIEKRLLRHVSEAFSEDPLRVLRVARFAARFNHLGFQIAPETLTLMQQISASGELEHLTPERVWSEMERALASPSPQVFLEALQDSHALAHLVPEFAALLASPQASMLKQRLEHAGTTDTDAAARLALICYYLPITQAQLSELLQKLRTPKKVSELCLLSHELADQLLDIATLSAEQQLQLYKQLDLLRRPERADTLSTVCGLIKADQSIAKSCQQHLQNLATTLASIEPKALVGEGFKGAELGAELHKRQLQTLKDAQL